MRARSHVTRQSLVQAATGLWRANGMSADHVATVAQSLVSEGARRWAMGAFGDRSFAEVVGRDIAALITGYSSAQFVRCESAKADAGRAEDPDT